MSKILKFSANISSLFLDIPDHIDSYKELFNRKDYRFRAVEAQDPYKNSLDDWKKALEEVGDLKPEFVLINSVNLSGKSGLPTEEEFDNNLKQTIEYAKTLKARKVHLLLSDIKDESEMKQAKQLLAKGSRILNESNLMCLIEPLSTRKDYYLRSYDVALNILNELKEPNLKILFDTFHCQCLHGNITHYIQLLKDKIGHVQISQVPLRDCPIHDGELNYDYILKALDIVYKDYIGLEYFNSVDDNFEWVKKYAQEITDI